MTNRIVDSFNPIPLSSDAKFKDLVFVRELFVKAVTGVDAWHRPQPQPLSISIWLHTSVSEAGSTDHLTYSLNYDVISRHVTRVVEAGRFKTLEEVASRVAETVLAESTGGQWATIRVKKLRSLLRAESAEIIIDRRKYPSEKGGFTIAITPDSTDIVKIHKLQLVTIIGVNHIERLHRQNVVIDLTLYKPAAPADSELPDNFNKNYDFRQIVNAVSDHVEDSSYKTVEAFVTSVAQVVCGLGVDRVTVRAEKPSALTFADAAGVEITRTAKDFDGQEEQLSALATPRRGSTSPPLFPPSGTVATQASVHTTYIAFGSNEGDPVANIYESIQQLEARGIKVLGTSSMYVSEPMFVADQNKFHNGVFACETTLEPLPLLDALKDIETNELKRVKLMDNGPRSIDLDIILYDDLVMNHPRLNIPHIGMLSRSFVLRPLSELVPPTLLHPLTAESIHSHLQQIPASSDAQVSSDLATSIPLAGGRGELDFDPNTNKLPTQLMAVLNVTPDSFSDGGKVNLDNIVNLACTYVKQGATILDIGGMSTNPKAVDPGEETELDRVVPAIAALRKCAELDKVAISIDTYRGKVAEQAILAGADIINDISGGVLDPSILDVAREHKVPIILGHTRGRPEEMAKLAQYSAPDSGFADNSDEAVIEVVGRELEERVAAAAAAGLPRWLITVDPGIGFAKTLRHNLAIIRNLDKLKQRPGLAGLVFVLGPSRKRFIGTITGQQEAAERVMGTAAAVTSLISKGADVVRVHDVAEMAQVSKMADAVYRGILPE